MVKAKLVAVVLPFIMEIKMQIACISMHFSKDVNVFNEQNKEDLLNIISYIADFLPKVFL